MEDNDGDGARVYINMDLRETAFRNEGLIEMAQDVPLTRNLNGWR